MKKILSTLLISSATLAAADNLDTSNIACHCDKHNMIFNLKDGEKISEMSKHCMINEDKAKSSVKLFDDNSKQTIKCNLKNGAVQLNSCAVFKPDTSSYKQMESH